MTAAIARLDRTLADVLAAHGGVRPVEQGDCLAATASRAGSTQEAARLFGAADGIRRRTGAVRLKIHDADWHAWLTELRESMDDNDFDSRPKAPRCPPRTP